MELMEYDSRLKRGGFPMGESVGWGGGGRVREGAGRWGVRGKETERERKREKG